MKRLLFYAFAVGLLAGAGCDKEENPLESEYAYKPTSRYIYYSNWHQASAPLSVGAGKESLSIKGHLYWYNPYEQVLIHEIWPDRKISTKYGASDRVNVLTLVFSPNPSVFPSTNSWAGIQTVVPRDSVQYCQPSHKRYLDLWIKGDYGCLHIDLGQISEDIIPDGRLNTEDRVDKNSLLRNGYLDEDEDTGIDGVYGEDPPTLFYDHQDAQIIGNTAIPFDFWDLNGDSDKSEDEPWSYDDWHYEGQSGDNKRLNGTENSKNSSVCIFPDAEDMNGNGGLDTDNQYLEYSFRLEKNSPDTHFIVEPPLGTSLYGWYHYRIPLNWPTQIIGEDHSLDFEFCRIWIDGVDTERLPDQFIEEGFKYSYVSIASFHFSAD